jgi:hypothetical protein
MAAPEDVIRIDATSGMDESAGDRSSPVQTPKKITNCVWSKDRELSKRNGFTQISPFVTEPGTTAIGSVRDTERAGSRGDCRSIFSTTKELCVVGARDLYARSEVHDRFYHRGKVSPFGIKSTPELVGDNSYICCDSAEIGGYRLTVGQGAHVNNTDINWTIEVRGEDSDGNQTIQYTHSSIWAASGFDDRYHGPKLAALTSNQMVVLLAKGGYDASAAASLEVLSYDLTEPNINLVSVGTLTAALGYDNGKTGDCLTGGAPWDNSYTCRLHDVCAITHGIYEGGYCVAWVSTTWNLEVRVYNSAHAQQLSYSLGQIDDEETDIVRVAICETTQHTHVGGGNGFYVMIVTESGENLRGVYVNELADEGAGLVSIVGMTSVDVLTATTTTGPNADNLGLVNGRDENGFEIVSLVWAWWDITIRSYNTRHRSFTPALDSSTSIATMYNCLPRAAPFNHGGRTYCPIDVGPPGAWTITLAASDVYAPSGGWTTSTVIDLDEDKPSHPVAQSEWTVGHYNVGVASPISPASSTLANTVTCPQPRPCKAGSLNNVSGVGSEFAWAISRLSTWVDLAPSLGTSLGNPANRSSLDRVVVDFDQPVMATALSNGAAIIGGGAVFYYSGHETFAFGYHVAPFVERVDIVNSGGTLDSTATYTWAAYWGHRDGAGVFHRGYPGPSVSASPVTGSTNKCTLLYFNYPGLIKEPILHLSRSGPSYNLSASNELCAVTANIKTAETISIVDTSSYIGPMLYVSAGELESVGPEGGNIPIVALGRLWLGDMATQNRFQYSKEFIPGSSYEAGIAPEMNEGLGKLLGDSTRVTGMANLDEKVVIFTDETISITGGPGPDPTGGGIPFDLTRVASNKGCIEPRSVVATAAGVFFQSTSGLQVLSRGMTVEWIGKPVRDTLLAYPTVTSAVEDAALQSVRFTCTDGTTSIILAFNYDVNAWSVWELEVGGDHVLIGGTMHAGDYYVLTTDGGVYRYDRNSFLDDGKSFPQSIEYNSIQAAEWQRVKRLTFQGEVLDAVDITVEMTTDLSDIVGQTNTYSAEAATKLNDLDVHVVDQKCQAKGLKITGTDASTSAGEGFRLTSLVWRVVKKVGQAKLPAVRRT